MTETNIFKTLSTKQQIEICNAINTAVANNKTVMMGDMQIAGAFPTFEGIWCVKHGSWDRNNQAQIFRLGENAIRSFVPTKGSTEVIYDPQCFAHYSWQAVTQEFVQECRKVQEKFDKAEKTDIHKRLQSLEKQIAELQNATKNI